MSKSLKTNKPSVTFETPAATKRIYNKKVIDEEYIKILNNISDTSFNKSIEYIKGGDISEDISKSCKFVKIADLENKYALVAFDEENPKKYDLIKITSKKNEELNNSLVSIEDDAESYGSASNEEVTGGELNKTIKKPIKKPIKKKEPAKPAKPVVKKPITKKKEKK